MNNQPRIPDFIELLNQAREIHEKKNKDYASEVNPFSNFERSAELMSWFTNKADKSFVSLIGAKLARLSELLQERREPQNETVEDTFLDLFVYVGLWSCYYKRKESFRKIWEVKAGIKGKAITDKDYEFAKSLKTKKVKK